MQPNLIEYPVVVEVEFAKVAEHVHLAREHRQLVVRVKNNCFTEMCSGSEAGSYLRLIDSCITQIKAQGPSRTCNESKEEHVRVPCCGRGAVREGGGARASRKAAPPAGCAKAAAPVSGSCSPATAAPRRGPGSKGLALSPTGSEPPRRWGRLRVPRDARPHALPGSGPASASPALFVLSVEC